MRCERPLLYDRQGSVIVVILVLVFGFLMLAVGGLTSSRSDLRASRNYTTGMDALMCAEAGVLHGQKAIESYGVLRFDVDVVPRWTTLWGTGAVFMPENPDCAYTVGSESDPFEPADYMILTSFGTGRNSARRSVKARLFLRDTFTPGAIYLANPDVQALFTGAGFEIDGVDHNLDGSAGPTAPVPGIATTTAAAADGILDALGSRQLEKIVGAGGAESVLPAEGPSLDRIVDEIVPGILDQPGVFTDPALQGSDQFGTTDQPQITRFTGNVTLTGNVNGAGILIVDGGMTLTGNLHFEGLVLVRGTTDLTTLFGNSTILGSLWTTDLQVRVGGSSSVTYSSEALNLANRLGLVDILPRRVQVVAWTEL